MWPHTTSAESRPLEDKDKPLVATAQQTIDCGAYGSHILPWLRRQNPTSGLGTRPGAGKREVYRASGGRPV